MLYQLACLLILLLAGDGFSIIQNVHAQSCSKEMSWKSGQSTFDSEVLGDSLTLYNNVWGASSASSSSSQSVHCKSNSEGKISWSTTFDFTSSSSSSDNQVKSYSNVGWAGTPVKISDLKSFSTSWSWSLSSASSNLVADVSLDIFTSSSASCSGQSGGCATHEVMIWLVTKGGAAPAGQSTGKTVTVGSYSFEVWTGVVGVPVISLVPTGGKQYTKFNANLVPLFQTGLKGFGLSDAEYITTIGSGIEPFKGSATLSSTYSVQIS
ncbi:endoglucanase [Melampsora americana]|nr:endoglucanase [Melampsora americana]